MTGRKVGPSVGTPLKTGGSVPKVVYFEGIPKASEEKTLKKPAKSWAFDMLSRKD
jgi:hypothetical protein